MSWRSKPTTQYVNVSFCRYDLSFNPTDDEQAVDRVHRLGQVRPVTVLRLVTRNTVEENIWRMAQDKMALADALRDPSASSEPFDSDCGDGSAGRASGTIAATGLSFQRLLAQALSLRSRTVDDVDLR
jgi:hypothetical protein